MSSFFVTIFYHLFVTFLSLFCVLFYCHPFVSPSLSLSFSLSHTPKVEITDVFVLVSLKKHDWKISSSFFQTQGERFSLIYSVYYYSLFLHFPHFSMNINIKHILFKFYLLCPFFYIPTLFYRKKY